MITWLGTAPTTSGSGKGGGPNSSHIGEMWGAVDPRVTYRPYNKLYYVTWDNCTKHCWPQRITYLSTTINPYSSMEEEWKFHGPVFPFPYTSGAAMLFRDDDNNDNEQSSSPPHLAFVCNSNTADTIFIVESYNGINWTIPKAGRTKVLMKGRQGCWDEKGVAIGPQPERLSNGDYLLIYNIDTGYPYHPNPLGRCAIGWAILDSNDPTTIVARANQPLIIATQPWETCSQSQNNKTCNVPMVVFASGLKPLGDDKFYIIYGGADSVVMVSTIKVEIGSESINVS